MFNNGLTVRRRGLLLMSLLTVVLALVAGSILWHSIETTSVSTVQQQVDRLKPLLTSLRVLLIAIVALCWPIWMKWLHRWGRFNEGQARVLQASHWRIVTWLIVIEVMLGQNLLAHVLSAWQGGAA